MPKIVIIGAGSGFGSRLSIDILSREPLRDATIALCDVDRTRLDAVARYIQRVIDAHKLPAKLVASTERKDLLPGADFVITSVSVGGAAYWGFPYNAEIHIPQKYGVDQSVGDTIGPGGVFRFLRTGPVQLEFCRDIERYCPNALLINYTNPMCMLTWLHSTGSSVRNVGLCHSVQWTTHELAQYLNVPLAEVDCWVAGINHQAWFLALHRKGQDLYPALREASRNPEICKRDTVRFEMFKHLGYFVTESTPHNSEYLPYFRRTPELRERFGLKGNKVVADKGGEREWMKQTGGEEAKTPELKRSNEYASGIIESVFTDLPLRFNGNVMNTGLITNLPQGCCVEVPCLADKQGVHPCYVGALPTACAAINRTNVSVQELAVEAVLKKDREAAFHAVALDPLTAACCALEQIRAMFEEMWAAEQTKGLLNWFEK
jgi:alpha-galactosidase